MPRIPEAWGGKIVPKTVRFQRNDPGINADITMTVRLNHPERFAGRKVEVTFDGRIEFMQHIQDCIRVLAESGIELPDTLG